MIHASIISFPNYRVSFFLSKVNRLGNEPFKVFQWQFALLPRMHCTLPTTDPTVRGFSMVALDSVVHHAIVGYVELVGCALQKVFDTVFVGWSFHVCLLSVV